MENYAACYGDTSDNQDNWGNYSAIDLFTIITTLVKGEFWH